MSLRHSKKACCLNSTKRRGAKRETKTSAALPGFNRSEDTMLGRVDPQPMQPAASTLADHSLTPRALTKSHKGAILVPEPQQEQIRLMYVQGMSMTKIAKAVHRDVHTISKVVRTEEMQELQEAVRKRYWATAMQAVDSIESHIERDGWLAHQVLKDIGVIPKQTANVEVSSQQPMTDQEEEQAIQDLTMRITKATIERSRIFRLPLPQIEQLDQEEAKETRERLPLFEKRDEQN